MGWARSVSRRWCNDGAQPLAWSWESPSPSHGLGKPFPAPLLLFSGDFGGSGVRRRRMAQTGLCRLTGKKKCRFKHRAMEQCLGKVQPGLGYHVAACLPAARSCCRTPRCCPELGAWHGVCGPVPLLPLTGGLGRKTLLLLHQKGLVVPRAAEMKLLVCSVAPGLLAPLARAVLPPFFYCMKNSKEQSVF